MILFFCLAWIFPVSSSFAVTVSVQTLSGCAHCGKNTIVNLTGTIPPIITYTIPVDNLGHGQLSGIYPGYYTLVFNQFSCEPVTVPNVHIVGDTTLYLQVYGVIAPATGLTVNPLTLVASWNFPVINSVLLSEDWSSGGFTANQWAVTGNNWLISNSVGNIPPSAAFTGSFGCTNCSQYLTSKTLNAGGAPRVYLQYDISLDNINTAQLNQMRIEVLNNGTWYIIKVFDNTAGSFSWITDILTISQYTAGDFKIRFQATGSDVSGINSWYIDNVKVYCRDSVPAPPDCLTGYNTGFQNILSAFTTDTTVQIDPQQVVYGQTYNYCVSAVYPDGISTPCCHTFTSTYLAPVQNVFSAPMDCGDSIWWQKPADPVALTALLGYRVYRHDMNTPVAYLPNPDSTHYNAFVTNPGIYQYGVSAVYNLAAYGFPGQTGQSMIIFTPGFDTIHCGSDLPFTENWENGGFGEHHWTFTPSPGNWTIGNGMKNSGLCAGFNGLPSCSNYSFTMISNKMDTWFWHCSSIRLDFDVKLMDITAGNSEKLVVKLFYDNSWHNRDTLKNHGSFDWTVKNLDISEVTGKIFNVGFEATGNNSTAILHWYLDNIHISGECMNPDELNYNYSQAVNLSWNTPGCNDFSAPDGYNVYRTGQNGLPPYLKINTMLVSGTVYLDNIQLNNADMYRYYVTSVFLNPLSINPLCESSGSDTILVTSVGMKELAGEPRIFPNPASGKVYIEGNGTNQEWWICNLTGLRMKTGKISGNRKEGIVVSDLPDGLYFLILKNPSFNRTFKLVVSH